MPKSRFYAAAPWRSLGIAALALLLGGTGAYAGECPADKIGVDVTKPGATASTDVSDNVLASIDLADQSVALPDHKFRMRRLEIQPGGEVAWHSHGERPAIIYVVSGEIFEYRNTCATPILHKAGDIAAEVRGTAHWWKNTGSEPVVLLSADILHDPSDKNM